MWSPYVRLMWGFAAERHKTAMSKSFWDRLSAAKLGPCAAVNIATVKETELHF